MIKRIFQDLDECVIYNGYCVKPTNCIEFELKNQKFSICVRPCAKSLFQIYKDAVGEDNVYILTTNSYEYTQEVVKLSNFEISSDKIISRRDVIQHYSKYCDPVPKHKLGHKDNILIDNNKYSKNSIKVAMMGIIQNNYFKTPVYTGQTNDDELLLREIQKFISSRLK